MNMVPRNETDHERPTHDQPHETPQLPPKATAPVKAGRAILLLVVAAVAVAVTGVKDRKHNDQQLARWTEEQAIPTVALVSPQQSKGPRELVLPGNVEAYYTAAIHGQVSGYVQDWRKDIGARVVKGDILAVVDTPELDESISVAENELAKAKANLVLAQVTAKRWDSLRATGAVSQQTADEKESDARAKEAEVAAAQANVDRLKAEKAFANIVAPFDGVVTARNVDVGALVKADGNGDTLPLFKVADVHQMRIYVPVPESYAAQLKDGMKATLELPELPGRSFNATIETTSHAIDQSSRTLLVELLADNPNGDLSPGAFARVHFEIPPDPNTLKVPASALVFRDNAVQVAAVGVDNRIALKTVEVLRDLGSEVEIRGLDRDERIVASPSDSIAEGEEVRLMQAANEKPAQAVDAAGGEERDAPNSAAEMAQTGRKHGE